MAERRWKARLLAVVLTATLGAVGGCGVSTSGAPTDIGDPLDVGSNFGNEPVRMPDGPSLGGSAETLVRLYLKAASGGDSLAIGRRLEFLDKNARKSWRDPGTGQSQMMVIRLAGDVATGAEVGNRTPVTITYKVVGSLDDRGQIAELGDPSAVRSMTFWVAREADSSPRIDEIVGADASALMITDDALTEFYRPQPIYFWDATNTHLIPDLRYLPLTLGPDQRAQRVVQWLLDAPSPWLQGAQLAPRLPSGTGIKDGVTKTERGSWVINLTAPNGLGDGDAVRRLYYQLQWSLRTGSTPAIDLEIEGQLQRIGGSSEDYLKYNLSYDLGQVRQAGFDIVDEKVVTAPVKSPVQPALLTSKDNANVVYAAMSRAADALALVRKDAAGKSYLQIVRDTTGAHTDVNIPHRTDTRRPVWLPGSSVLLVPSGGYLYLVLPSGAATDITPARRTGVTSVSVAPDGRRLAWVAGGQAFVAPLIADGVSVSIGPPRLILPGETQLNAAAVAWTSEAWLNVVGTVGTAGAMWQTTVDSGVAMNVSEALRDTRPTDVIALATGTSSGPGQALLFTAQGLYTFGTLLSGEPALKTPFFVS